MSALGPLVEGLKAEARRVQGERLARLEAFRGGISQGAREVAARHLYQAGVYGASLRNGFTYDPEERLIFETIWDRVMAHDRLKEFYSIHSDLVKDQGLYVDAVATLKGFVSRRQGLEGRLTNRMNEELRLADEALRRLEELEKYLQSWREGVRLESRVRIEQIFDKHRV